MTELPERNEGQNLIFVEPAWRLRWVLQVGGNTLHESEVINLNLNYRSLFTLCHRSLQARRPSRHTPEFLRLSRLLSVNPRAYTLAQLDLPSPSHTHTFNMQPSGLVLFHEAVQSQFG